MLNSCFNFELLLWAWLLEILLNVLYLWFISFHFIIMYLAGDNWEMSSSTRSIWLGCNESNQNFETSKCCKCRLKCLFQCFGKFNVGHYQSGSVDSATRRWSNSSVIYLFSVILSFLEIFIYYYLANNILFILILIMLKTNIFIHNKFLYYLEIKFIWKYLWYFTFKKGLKFIFTSCRFFKNNYFHWHMPQKIKKCLFSSAHPAEF